MSALEIPGGFPNTLYERFLDLVDESRGYGGDYKRDPWDYPQGHPHRPEKSGHTERKELCNAYSWSVPTPGAIRLIAGLSPLVEIGAGRGYWARLLSEAGADVVVYDRAPPFRGISKEANSFHYGDDADLFWTVHPGGPEKAALHHDRTLLLCWPPHGSPMAFDALTAYQDAGGQRVVYIGEGPLGCTGDEKFHEALGHAWRYDDEDEPLPTSPWRETKSFQVPNWPGIHDQGHIFERAQ